VRKKSERHLHNFINLRAKPDLLNRAVLVAGALLVTLIGIGTGQASADLIDFESGFEDRQRVETVVTETNTVTLGVGPKEGPNRPAYIAMEGVPQTAYFPVDTIPGSSGGKFFLTDEAMGPHIGRDYFITFSSPVSDLSLDLYDFRNDVLTQVGQSATLNVFDGLGNNIGSSTSVVSSSPNPNLIVFSIPSPDGLIKSAQLTFSRAEVGTGIDNIRFTTAGKEERILILTDRGGDNQWNTRPTFGVSHETLGTQMVDSGFTFNGNYFTITDNHHTPFATQSVGIGAVNSFAATVWADKGLKVQEFLFGVPQVGMGHMAEMRVEVWYDLGGRIDDVKIIQETDVVDPTSVSITHQKVKCTGTDVEEKCDRTLMSAVFLEPLRDRVMAIKATDFKLRDQTTYLNDGFEIQGESLNPMPTKMIPSPAKGEGLIRVTQNEKYSDYWTSDDGRIFEMNSFGSFKQTNHEFKRFQDKGEARTRLHSGFEGVLNSEQDKASKIFDSSKLISQLPDSFGFHYEYKKRIDDAMRQQMLHEEQKAKSLLERNSLQARW